MKENCITIRVFPFRTLVKTSVPIGNTNKIVYEWQDKAGGYAIQGTAAKWVKSIQGDYYNVVGLPISRVYQELKKYGVV